MDSYDELIIQDIKENEANAAGDADEYLKIITCLLNLEAGPM
jgi:hypothetical protein